MWLAGRVTPPIGGKGIRRHGSRPKAATASKVTPASGRDLTGPGPSYSPIPLLPDPSRQVPHSNTAGTFARENVSEANANTLPGFPPPRVPQTIPSPGRAPSSTRSGLGANRRDPAFAQTPEKSEAETFQSNRDSLHFDDSELGITLQSGLSLP